MAVLTPDGTLANPLALRVGDQRLLHLYFSSEDFALTWPEPDECLPRIGHEAPPLEGWQVERRQYLELAQQVIGDAEVDYTDLYQRFAKNDWAAVKLDDAVALKGLKAGHSPKTVVGILHQSPYVQHQVHHNRVPVAPMSQYVRSTVMKVLQQWKQAPSSQRRQQQKGLDLE